MRVVVNAVHPTFMAEIAGADLTVPPTEDLVRIVEDTMAHYAAVVIRGARITDEQHIRFGHAFGELETPPARATPAGMKRRLRPELYDASNLDENGQIIPFDSERRRLDGGALRFHCDNSFLDVPTSWSFLRGVVVPPKGGDTHIIDTRAVHESLPEETRAKIEDLVVVHDFWSTRERLGLVHGPVTDDLRAWLPPVRHPLVRTSASGRKALYIGGHACGIVGWPKAKGLRFLEELHAFATRPERIHAHEWQPDDLLIFDNRCTLHAATPLNTNRYVRDLRRVTINERRPPAKPAPGRAKPSSKAHVPGARATTGRRSRA